MRKAQKRALALVPRACPPRAPLSEAAAEASPGSLTLLPDSVQPSEEPGDQDEGSSTCSHEGAGTITIRQHRDVDIANPVLFCPTIEAIEDFAAAFFLTNYAPLSNLSCVLSHPSLRLTSPALDALRATSLAYVSMTISPKSPPALTRLTSVAYGIALSHTNASLADPSSAAADTTLLAVLLLSHFESLNLRGPSSCTAWLAHARGTKALLRLRQSPRRRDYCSSPSRELNRLAALQVRISGVLRPEPVHFDTEDLGRGEVATAAELRTDRLLDHIVRLRLLEDPRDGTVHDHEVLRQTMDLDAGIASRAAAAAPLPRPGPGPEYARAARSWITMRIVRLYLNSKLLQSQDLSPGFDGGYDPAVRGAARRNSRQVAAEILDVVPGLLEAARRGGAAGLAVVARHLIWPLALFARSDLCPAPRRGCLLGQLREITEGWNLVPPAEAARLLEGSAHPGDWYDEPIQKFSGPVMSNWQAGSFSAT